MCSERETTPDGVSSFSLLCYAMLVLFYVEINGESQTVWLIINKSHSIYLLSVVCSNDMDGIRQKETKTRLVNREQLR